ncbi:MAG: hypothetical protein ACREEJ_19415 [Ensifer adhaerens]
MKRFVVITLLVGAGDVLGRRLDQPRGDDRADAGKKTAGVVTAHIRSRLS